jgi:hypothetical protein
MRFVRSTGTVILAFSLLVLAIFGGWPSLKSVGEWVAVGLVGGVLIGIFSRVLIPRDKRLDFLYNLNPGLAKRVLRLPRSEGPNGGRPMA